MFEIGRNGYKVKNEDAIYPDKRPPPNVMPQKSSTGKVVRHEQTAVFFPALIHPL